MTFKGATYYHLITRFRKIFKVVVELENQMGSFTSLLFHIMVKLDLGFLNMLIITII